MEALFHTLQEGGYKPLAQYSFRELVIPLREGLQTRNVYVRLFLLFFLLGCGAAGVFAGMSLGVGHLSFGAVCGWLLLGVPATFLLVPLHEMLHGLMFRWYGAKDVRYGVIWRYLMFYAVAHAHVVHYRQFRYIAMAPFAVISGLCAVVFPFVPAQWQALLLGLYCFHTLCCAGDFGLCAYFFKYRARNPVSFDDANNGVSYFYALPDPSDAENA